MRMVHFLKEEVDDGHEEGIGTACDSSSGCSLETHFLWKATIQPFFVTAPFTQSARSPCLGRWKYFLFSPEERNQLACSGLFDRFWPEKCHISKVLAPESLLMGTSSILGDKIVNGRFTVQLIRVTLQTTERQEARAPSFIRIGNQTSVPFSPFCLSCRCPTENLATPEYPIELCSRFS